MKVVALQAENIKRLVAIEIRPDGNLVQNGQGKSSVLDSLWWALAGAGTVQAEPIRQGEDSARIRLDLGEIIVTRKFIKNEEGATTSSLIVENAEGARYQSPQKMLDALLGELTFDPLAFSRMPSKDKFHVLKKFVPVDFSALESANATDYQERTSLNRRARDAKALADSIVISSEDAETAIDEATLMDELEKAQAFNKTIEETATKRKATTDRIAYLRSGLDAQLDRTAKEVTDLENRIKTLKHQAEQEKARTEGFISKHQDELAALGDPVEPLSLEKITSELRRSKLVNEQVAKRQRKADFEKEAQALADSAAEKTQAIDTRNESAVATIAAAQMPVSGVSLSPEGAVTLNGVPFEQASDAEQLRASIEFAMAVNPKLRVIRVRDGSLLDEDALAMLAKMCADKDYQVWLERVDSSGKVGFVLEEGKIKNVGN